MMSENKPSTEMDVLNQDTLDMEHSAQEDSIFQEERNSQISSLNSQPTEQGDDVMDNGVKSVKQTNNNNLGGNASQLTNHEGVPYAIAPTMANEQVGLSELSIYKWGIFDGLFTGYFDPVHGTFITGANGSGKTTYIDAYQLLFLSPSNTTFNLAASQGNKKDRNVMSYLRGDTGASEHNGEMKIVSKRSSATISAVRGLFTSTTGREITATVLLYINSSSRQIGDIKRVYLLSESNLKLEDILDSDIINNSTDWVKELKRKLKDVEFFNGAGAFNEYIEKFKRLIGIKNENAIPLMFRVQGTKQITNVDEMIRTHVLEGGNLAELAQDIIGQFTESEEIYKIIDDTTKQIKALSPLVDLSEKREQLIDELAQHEQEQEGLSIYIAKKKSRALMELREIESEKLKEKQFEIKENSEKLSYLDEDLSRQERHYIEQGGDKISHIEDKIRHCDEMIKIKSKAVNHYLNKCRSFGLSDELSESALHQNQTRVLEVKAQAQKEKEEYNTKYHDIGAKLYDRTTSIKRINDEIKSLQATDTNIDPKYLALREQITSALNIDVAFVGELIQVKESELAWRGAIERALGADKTTILVQPNNYESLTCYLNSHHLGINVKVERVSDVKEMIMFEDNKFLSKLEWKKSPFTPFLKKYLLPRDLTCVNDVNELNITPYSMTKEGLIHRRSGSFEKFDRFRVDDPKTWQTGFSNKEKIEVLISEVQTLTEERNNLIATQSEISAHLAKLNQQLEFTLDVEFDDINIQPYQVQKQSLMNELALINQADLESLRLRIQETKEKIQLTRSLLSVLNQDLGTIQTKLMDYSSRLEDCRFEAEKEVDESLYNFDYQFLSSQEESLARAFYQDKIEKTQVRINQVINNITLIIGEYRGVREWKQHSVDFGNQADDVQDYLNHLDKLVKTELPAQKDKAKQRMEKHTTESIINFMQTARDECNKIIRNIQKINPTLEKADYVDNSYLQLIAKEEHFDIISKFNKASDLVITQFDGDIKDRYGKLKTVIDMLREALKSNSIDAKRLLDPRYRFSFAVNVINRETNETSVLSSSSGKSGGEKEVFASLILAASLSYVLTNEQESLPHFNTVFIDEAFSNTSYENARRGLFGFKNLGLSVNMIMPEGKGHEIGEEFTRKVIITKKRQQSGCIEVCEWNRTKNDEVTYQDISPSQNTGTLRSFVKQLFDK